MAEIIEKEIETSSQSINILDLTLNTLRHWKWIVISVCVCLLFALICVLRAQPIYEREASIVIKDDTQGNSISSEMSAFADMGFLQTKSNILDEINHLNSPDVMTEVIKRLDLMMNYYTKGTFHKNVVYGPALPIDVDAQSLLDEDAMSMNVNINADGTYVISDLKTAENNFDFVQDKPVPLDSTIVTPIGQLTVRRTAYFTPGEEYDIYVAKSTLSSTLIKYQSEFNIKLFNDKGNTITITVKDNSPVRADDLIQTLISVYNQKWIENRNIIAVATSNFISNRLNSLEHELGNVDKDISSYQSEHLIPNIETATDIYMKENQEANNQILELNNALQMSRYMREFITSPSNRNSVLPTNIGINNPAIEKQLSLYNDVVLERAQYGNATTEHPYVIKLDNNISEMRAAIIAAIDNQIVGLNTQIKNLRATQSKTTTQIAASPNRAKYLLSVKRQQKVKESLYLFLLQKREENELSQAFTAYKTQIIAMPHGSKFPIAPHKARILGIAFILGLLIPFGVMFCIESLNTKVRGRKDLENVNAPFLGEIPDINKKNKKKETKNSIVVKQGSRNPINEAFRVLRTNLSFIARTDEGAEVEMVTSFNAGSGKSFISVNLGASFAIKGKKVLVIDGDLRHASASQYVGMPSKGLSDYLIGQVSSPESVIVKVNDNIPLYVLPVGSIPPNPTELLESDRLPQAIDKLRSQYDYIIIDCPPAEIMADAQIVNKYVDRTIFILRAGLLERSMLNELEKIYKSKKFKNLGIILNGTHVNGGRYGYRYGYGYGYRYGYGYGDGYSNNKDE